MNSEDVTTLLEKTLAGCQIEVDSQGSHFNVLVVGDLFKGKRAVQRQQLIYAVLNESISSGAISRGQYETVHSPRMVASNPIEAGCDVGVFFWCSVSSLF